MVCQGTCLIFRSECAQYCACATDKTERESAVRLRTVRASISPPRSGRRTRWNMLPVDGAIDVDAVEERKSPIETETSGVKPGESAKDGIGFGTSCRKKGFSVCHAEAGRFRCSITAGICGGEALSRGWAVEKDEGHRPGFDRGRRGCRLRRGRRGRWSRCR